MILFRYPYFSTHSIVIYPKSEFLWRSNNSCPGTPIFFYRTLGGFTWQSIAPSKMATGYNLWIGSVWSHGSSSVLVTSSRGLLEFSLANTTDLAVHYHHGRTRTFDIWWSYNLIFWNATFRSQARWTSSPSTLNEPKWENEWTSGYRGYADFGRTNERYNIRNCSCVQ